MIRNWTAESTEKVFYDLCDEYGIMVFNDFGLSTENFNLLPHDFDLFLDNAEDIVKRFRNHPSIVVWCPQNEGFPPAYLEKGFSDIIARHDGTRHYIGNSRTMNSMKSGPWEYKPPTAYFDMANGFASEVGSPSLPTAESVRKMMAAEDLWPIGDVWYYHDWLMGKWGKNPFMMSYGDGIDNQFGRSDGVDDFCKKAQLINYESYRAIFEAWNSKLFDRTSGVLLWMSHPAWPSMVWQTYSWDYETPGAYFGAKKACEPLHIQYDIVSRKVQVVNASPKEYHQLKAEAAVYSLKGKKLSESVVNIYSESNSVVDAIDLRSMDEPEGCFFIKLALKDKRGRMLSDNLYWMSQSSPRDFTSLNELPPVKLKGSARAVNDGKTIKGVVEVVNNTSNVALAIKLNLRTLDGIPVLPTYFSEGYFTLMPGEKRNVSFDAPVTASSGLFKITAEGHNVDIQDIGIIN